MGSLPAVIVSLLTATVSQLTATFSLATVTVSPTLIGESDTEHGGICCQINDHMFIKDRPSKNIKEKQ